MICVEGSPLYQWDLNRQLKVESVDIERKFAVHCCHKEDTNSLVVEPIIEGETILVNIPNILLQRDGFLRVYVVIEGDTVYDTSLYVIARPKPDDYIYTETDVFTVEKVVNNALEKARENGELVGETISEGGEIFNDYENNQAIAPYSHAKNKATRAGAYAFAFDEEYYARTDVDFSEDVVGGEYNEGWYHLTSVEGLDDIIGATYTVVLTSNYDFRGEIKAVDNAGKRIRVTNFLLPNERKSDGSGNYIAGQKLRTVADSGIDRSYILFVDHTDIGDIVVGEYARSEGENTVAAARSANAGGRETKAVGKYSTARGRNTYAGFCARADGQNTKATGEYSSTDGTDTVASGKQSNARGNKTEAIGVASSSEGILTKAIGNYSHVEGNQAEAVGKTSHAQGNLTKAEGDFSHSGGDHTYANHESSFTHGKQLKTGRDRQAVFGEYNSVVEDALLVVGNGESTSKLNNALVVKEDGRVQAGANPTGGLDVVTKGYGDGAYVPQMSADHDFVYAWLKDTSGVYKPMRLKTTTYGASSSAWTLPRRDGDGGIGVQNIPTKDTHAVSKKYVDDLQVSMKGYVDAEIENLRKAIFAYLNSSPTIK